MSEQPMRGVRVVDFTHILAGPYCTMLLADAGADVIKIEPPNGEFGRIRGPQRSAPDGARLSSFFAAVNRGKRTVALDLKQPAGLELALELVGTADVVVENFAPGTLAKLGVDFAGLRAQRPALITCSMSLFGGQESAGALATRGGLAVVAEGESSFAGMTRNAEGHPVQLGVPLGDMATGLAGFGAICAAVYQRFTTGQGQHLDLSMVRTLWSLNSVGATIAQIDEDAPRKFKTAAYGIFASADGHVVLGINSDSLFQRAMAAMGMPEVAHDPRFQHYEERDQRAAEVDAIVTAWTSERTTADIVATIGPSGVPCGRVATPHDVIADDQLRAMGYVADLDDTLGGMISVPANPMNFGPGTGALSRVGANTREVLAEIGVDSARFDALALQGAFGSEERIGARS